jgi:hypothetical protein
MNNNPLASIHNYENPDWKPLERAVTAAGLPVATCGEFMWMCENPAGVHQYKHRDTRQYAHLTASMDTAVAVSRVKGARL